MNDAAAVLARLSVNAAAALIATWWIVALVAFAVVLSVARNLARTRRAVERIADALDAAPLRTLDR